MLSVTVLALAVLSTTVTAARCRTDTPRCPNENGCTFTTQNGAMFELKCANDFDGNVIEITEVLLVFMLITFMFYSLQYTDKNLGWNFR